MIYREWLEWRNDYFKLNKNFHYSDMDSDEKAKLKENCKNLLDDITLRAREEDEIHKTAAIRAGKGSQAVGESWMVFHLKALKEGLDKIL